MFDRTYFKKDGTYGEALEILRAMLPREGSVPKPKKNPALERLRKALEVYADYHHFRLVNCRSRFKSVFGYKPPIPEFMGGREGFRLERKMDGIIQVAAAEQGVALVEPSERRYDYVRSDGRFLAQYIAFESIPEEDDKYGEGVRRLLHRTDGPAEIERDGVEEWFKDGKPWNPPAHVKLAWAAKKAAIAA